ncbi:MAG: metalloprotease PmbA [Gammaproteobacteria bacterium]|jgi:PmbA protein|nr:metalloprotease PmbA [Gammaproteobacteria bacterium]
MNKQNLEQSVAQADRLVNQARNDDFAPEQLQALVSDVVAAARKLGATAVEAGIAGHRGLSATVRMGQVETVEHHRDRSLSISVYKGQQKGNASCGDLRPQSIHETLQRAMDIATYTEPDSCAGLVAADLLADEFPDLQLWHPHEMSAAELIERATRMEQAGRDVDHRIHNSEGASVGFDQSSSAYANSHGFCAAQRGTSFFQSLSLVAAETGDSHNMQRDYDWDNCRHLADLLDEQELGRRAAQRTIRRLGARSAKTTRAPILFTPEAARSLLGHLIAACSGGALYRQASFLLDQLGQPLFPEFVTIQERPLLPGAPGSASYDHDGVATGRHNELVAGGRLLRYVLGGYAARRLGLETTGNAGGVRNLLIAPGASSQQELLQQMGTGLVVTELMGQGVNTVTGDYSRGASGFWIENGAIAYPVQEVTIAGKLRDMYANLLALGNDVDMRGNVQTPSWLIREMTIAGDAA